MISPLKKEIWKSYSMTNKQDEIVTYTGTSYTNTWTPPTKEECIENILYHAEKLVNKKWWEDKSYHKERIKYYLSYLHD